MAALANLMSHNESVWTVTTVRSAIVAAVALALVRIRGTPLRFTNHPLLLSRALAGWIAMAAYFWSLPYLPLGDAITLQYTSPLFVALLAGRALGERIVAPVAGALLLGFVGVVLVARPDGAISFASVSALASGFFAAIAYLAVRSLRDFDHPDAIVVHFSVVATLLSAPLAILSGIPPKPEDALPLVGVGLTAAIGQLALTRAYALGDAAVVAGVSYVAVPIGAVLGFFVFSETPGPRTLFGAALIIASGLILVRR